MDFIIARLSEASTWRGIMVFLTGIGVFISPELQKEIIATGLGMAGMVGVFSKDKGAEK